MYVSHSIHCPSPKIMTRLCYTQAHSVVNFSIPLAPPCPMSVPRHTTEQRMCIRWRCSDTSTTRESEAAIICLSYPMRPGPPVPHFPCLAIPSHAPTLSALWLTLHLVPLLLPCRLPRPPLPSPPIPHRHSIAASFGTHSGVPAPAQPSSRRLPWELPKGDASAQGCEYRGMAGASGSLRRVYGQHPGHDHRVPLGLGLGASGHKY